MSAAQRPSPSIQSAIQSGADDEAGQTTITAHDSLVVVVGETAAAPTATHHQQQHHYQHQQHQQHQRTAGEATGEGATDLPYHTTQVRRNLFPSPAAAAAEVDAAGTTPQPTTAQPADAGTTAITAAAAAAAAVQDEHVHPTGIRLGQLLHLVERHRARQCALDARSLPLLIKLLHYYWEVVQPHQPQLKQLLFAHIVAYRGLLDREMAAASMPQVSEVQHSEVTHAQEERHPSSEASSKTARHLDTDTDSGDEYAFGRPEEQEADDDDDDDDDDSGTDSDAVEEEQIPSHLRRRRPGPELAFQTSLLTPPPQSSATAAAAAAAFLAQQQSSSVPRSFSPAIFNPTDAAEPPLLEQRPPSQGARLPSAGVEFDVGEAIDPALRHARMQARQSSLTEQLQAAAASSRPTTPLGIPSRTGTPLGLPQQSGQLGYDATTPGASSSGVVESLLVSTPSDSEFVLVDGLEFGQQDTSADAGLSAGAPVTPNAASSSSAPVLIPTSSDSPADSFVDQFVELEPSPCYPVFHQTSPLPTIQDSLLIDEDCSALSLTSLLTSFAAEQTAAAALLATIDSTRERLVRASVDQPAAAEMDRLVSRAGNRVLCFVPMTGATPRHTSPSKHRHLRAASVGDLSSSWPARGGVFGAGGTSGSGGAGGKLLRGVERADPIVEQPGQVAGHCRKAKHITSPKMRAFGALSMTPESHNALVAAEEAAAAVVAVAVNSGLSPPYQADVMDALSQELARARIGSVELSPIPMRRNRRRTSDSNLSPMLLA